MVWDDVVGDSAGLKSPRRVDTVSPQTRVTMVPDDVDL